MELGNNENEIMIYREHVRGNVHQRIIMLGGNDRAKTLVGLISWQFKATKICPSLTGRTPRRCRFSERAW